MTVPFATAVCSRRRLAGSRAVAALALACALITAAAFGQPAAAGSAPFATQAVSAADGGDGRARLVRLVSGVARDGARITMRGPNEALVETRGVAFAVTAPAGYRIAGELLLRVGGMPAILVQHQTSAAYAMLLFAPAELAPQAHAAVAAARPGAPIDQGLAHAARLMLKLRPAKTRRGAPEIAAVSEGLLARMTSVTIHGPRAAWLGLSAVGDGLVFSLSMEKPGAPAPAVRAARAAALGAVRAR